MRGDLVIMRFSKGSVTLETQVRKMQFWTFI